MKRVLLSLLAAFMATLFATGVMCEENAKGYHRISVAQGKRTQNPDADAAGAIVPLLRGKILKAGFEGSPKASLIPHKHERAMLLGTLRRVPQQYPTIQSGINASVDGDTVVVSEGTYFENISYRGKSIIVASVFLLDQDTSHISRTIIDGSQPVYPDSGSTVSFVSGEDTNSVLCGFTVRGGYGTYIPLWDEADGGGVFLWQSGGRLVRNIITGNNLEASNAWGGGVSITGFANVGQTLVMEQNIISRNIVTGDAGIGYGGGVGVYQSQFRLIGNVFDHDSSRGLREAGGGGVIIDGTADNQQVDVIRGNVFKSNVVVGDSFSYSGGMILVITGAAVIDNNSFEDNTVTGMHTTAYAGGISVWENSAATPEKQITGNIFRRNHVSSPNGYARGGALVNVQASVKLGWNQFQDNSLDAGISSIGGAIYANAWGGRIENNIITRNKGQYGGGIGYVGVPPTGVTQATVNNTVSNNVAEFGGGFYSGSNTTSILLNNIFWDDSSLSGEEISNFGSIEAHYSNIEGGWSGGTGNIDANPMFVDIMYRLANASPCIGAGGDSVQVGGIWYHAPTGDFGGNSRPMPAGSQPDMGAWENPRATPTSVGDGRSGLPAVFELAQNYPNPFNPDTRIRFAIPVGTYGPASPAGGRTSLRVYDVLGRVLATLVNEEMKPGGYEVTWDAAGFASGVYFYTLTTGSYVDTKRMILMK